MTQTVLGKIFQLQGWVVVKAATVAEALALLEPPPDLLVLDLMLPDGDGEAVLRAVRGAGLPTRVAVCSGVGESARLERVTGLKPDGVFRKPIDLADLRSVCGPPRAAGRGGQ